MSQIKKRGQILHRVRRLLRRSLTPRLYASQQLADDLTFERNALRVENQRLRDENFRLFHENKSLQPFLPDVFGHRMHVDPSDKGLPLHLLVGKQPVNGEAGYIARTVKPGDTAIDIGANVGLYALLLARQVGTAGRVYAFEPGPKSFSLLAQNIQENGYANATAEFAAVSDRSGTVDLYICRTGESDNRIEGTLLDPENRDRISVRSVTLDDYLAQKDIGAVDFIKLDVQGAEPFVLRGMRRTLRESPNLHLLMEYAPGFMERVGSSAREVLDIFDEVGFDMFVLPEDGVEHPTTREWLLENVAEYQEIGQINLLLKRRTDSLI